MMKTKTTTTTPLEDIIDTANEFFPSSTTKGVVEATAATAATTRRKSTKTTNRIILLINSVVCIYSIPIVLTFRLLYLVIVNNNNYYNVGGLISYYQTNNNNNLQLLTNHDDHQQHNEHENNNNNKGMYAIVHIGPYKTGTTTLQYMIDRLHIELELDQYQLPNYYVPNQLLNGTNMQVLGRCLENYTTIKYDVNKLPNYCDSNMILHIIHIASRYKNLLISAERLSIKEVQPKLLYTLLSPYHNNNNNNNNQIKIVIYYRRFYEWIVSWNNEVYEDRNINARESIYDWINNDNKIINLINDMYITGCYPRYLQYFPNNIHIVNMHESNHNLIENFFCNVLIHANYTCQKVQHNNMIEGSTNHNSTIIINNQNTATILIYEELVYAAIQMKIIKTTLSTTPSLTTIQSLAKKAHQYQVNTLLLNENNFTNYYKCPTSEKLNNILQITLNTELMYLPEFYNKESITAAFNHYKDMNKFCIVDVQYIISNNINGWKTFFQSITHE